MTWGNPPALKQTKPKKAPVPITPEMLAASGSEDGAQAAVFCWSAMSVGKYPQLKWLYSIPNGGSRHIIEATKLVGTGTRSGVPDICLPCPSGMRHIQNFNDGHYHGLYIEMKKEDKRNVKDGGCSKDQLEYLNYLESAGYFVAVCYTWIEARDILINYLEGKL